MNKISQNEKLNDLRVVLVDFYGSGHHESYLQALVTNMDKLDISYLVIGPSSLTNRIDSHKLCLLKDSEQLVGLNGIKRQIIIYHLCRQSIDIANNFGATHIHFVYVDWILSGLVKAWFSKTPKAIPIITVHWGGGVGIGGRFKDKFRQLPNRLAFIWFTKKTNTRVLVHHKSIVDELSKIVDKDKIGIIPYPATPLKIMTQLKIINFRRSIGISDNITLLLCYGNTRFDKGADLAVRALKYLPKEYHLLVVGSPQKFQPQDLYNLANKDGTKERLHIIPRFISEEETALVFYSCEIVLIPYRRFFSGQSGPLTLAAAIGKPVVVADLPVLKATVQEFRLGFVFPAEDILAMTEALLTTANWKPASDDTAKFVNQHSSSSFTNSVLVNYLLSCKEKNETN